MFSEQLRTLRRNKGLTQNELATKLKVSNGTIAMWETNKRQPDFDMINKIAELFNVSVSFLIGEQPIQKQKENTIRIIGRGGVIKEYTVTEEQQKAFETLLSTLPQDDPNLKF